MTDPRPNEQICKYCQFWHYIRHRKVEGCRIGTGTCTQQMERTTEGFWCMAWKEAERLRF